ncbi:MAG TPA: hypothetical protein VMT58_06575, partial [Candidatus Binataceae bacterium]|nr:hypothetical protein [Candidatus Binataceae bacterium]
ALAHRINPVITNYIWAPGGINLAWTTSIPLPSLLMWPVTAMLGPIAAFNLLGLIALPLAALSAYLLCKYVSKSWWPSLIGGYVFGFSPYLLSELRSAHPFATLVFPVPLAALIVARAINRELGLRKSAFALAAILVIEFLTSTEVFATVTMFGTITLCVGWLFAPAAVSRRIAESAVAILGAYLLAGLVLLPYLYYLFAWGMPQGEIWPQLNLRNTIGSLSLLPPIGLQLTAIELLYLWKEWRSPLCKTLVCALVAISVLMTPWWISILGITVPAPSRIVMALPLMEKALQGRFVLYAYLISAVITAVWFGKSRFGARIDIAIALVVVFAQLRPSFFRFPCSPAVIPGFFTAGTYGNYLKRGEIALVLPFGFRGYSSLWQAQTDMYYRTVGGNTGLYPPSYNDWPIFAALHEAHFMPDASNQMAAFLAHHDVAAVIVADSDPVASQWDGMFARLSGAQYHVGGVSIFRVDSSALQPYGKFTGSEMRRQALSAALDNLLIAAGHWIAAGNDPMKLTPFTALRQGLLKPSWFVGSTINPYSLKPMGAQLGQPGFLFKGAWFGGTRDGNVRIVIHGSYADLKPVIAGLRGKALHVYFPYPNDLLSPTAAEPAPDRKSDLEMDFDPKRLVAIAAELRPAQL